MKATHCRFSIACNHHHNGTFRGTAISFEFKFFANLKLIAGCHVDSKYADAGLRVSFACDSTARNEHTDQGIIVLGTNHAISYRSYQTWVGNWCWDSMTISPSDAVRLLRKLRRSGFSMDGGSPQLWRWWESIEVAPHHQLRPKGTPEQ